MSTDRTLFEQAVADERNRLGYRNETADDGETKVVDTGGVAARSTTIGGEDVDLADPQTTIQFTDSNGLLSGEYGTPRPRRFWHAKQVGQTPQMQLIKNTVAQQLTGGDVQVEADDELEGALSDLAALIEDIYDGPHFQRKSLDDLITDTVNDFFDHGWAYWEQLESADGSLPVAAFKPLPALSIQHNVGKDTGELIDGDDGPMVYHVPHKQAGSQVTVTSSDPDELYEDQVVIMRGPLTSENDTLYGQSPATKVREWLELITDADVHQKRHYADSQLPAGFVHFQGAVGDDKLQKIQQDILEVAGDPHEMVTTTSESGASWVPVGGDVADMDAIAQQKWYWKLVLSAVGLNMSEIGEVESSGFAKESPEFQRQIYKNVTKPFVSAIFGPQTNQAMPRIIDAIDAAPEGAKQDLSIGLERFDPVREQIEREETLQQWGQQVNSLNEVRGTLGKEAEEYLVEIGGTEIDLADTPRYVVDQLVRMEQPQLEVGNGSGEASADADPADIGADPVLSLREAADKLGIRDPVSAQKRLQANTKELEDTIEVQSSFLVSTAYERGAEIFQLEFEREGEPNWVYWYGSVPEFRFFNFLQADSKGRYFNEYIRGEFTYARLS